MLHLQRLQRHVDRYLRDVLVRIVGGGGRYNRLARVDDDADDESSRHRLDGLIHGLILNTVTLYIRQHFIESVALNHIYFNEMFTVHTSRTTDIYDQSL